MMHLRIDRREKPKGPIRGNIDGAFLYALYEHVADLVRRLSVLFDITWLQRFNITEELGEDGKRHLLMAYLESRQEQEVREAQLRIEAISNELDSIFTSLGLTPDDYDMLHASVSTDTKGGDEISNMGFNRRLTQVLKTRSRKANSRTVMTIERLLKESEDLRDRYNVDV